MMRHERLAPPWLVPSIFCVAAAAGGIWLHLHFGAAIDQVAAASIQVGGDGEADAEELPPLQSEAIDLTAMVDEVASIETGSGSDSGEGDESGDGRESGVGSVVVERSDIVCVVTAS